MLMMERGIPRVPPASQHQLCGHNLIPVFFPRKHLTEGGMKLEVEGVWAGSVWLRGASTPWHCNVRSGVVTSWKRDILNPALRSVRLRYKLGP